MSTDPMSLMLESLNDQAYNDLLRDAATDNRIGAHDALVNKVVVDAWDDGRIRQKVQFTLLTANNAKADVTLSKLPTPEEVKEESAGWDQGRKRGVAHSIAMARQLVQNYGLAIDPATGLFGFAEGQRYKVQTGKRTDRNDKAKYFVTVVAFLAKDHAVGAEAATAAAAPSERPAF